MRLKDINVQSFKFNMFMAVVISVLLRLTWAVVSVKDCDGTTNKTVWNCRSSNLSEIPVIQLGSNSANNFHILDISHNKITRLGKLNFSSNNEVSELFLSDNKISAIDTDAFEEMTKLATLDLSMNKITGAMLEEKQFDKLVNIKTLNMSRNPLRLIKKGVFTILDFDSLIHLDLSHCQIKKIEDGSLKLPHLEVLDLSWNELEQIHGHAFRSLRKLVTLNLSHNRLKALIEMPNLPVIKMINFDDNQISTVVIREAMGFGTQILEQMYIRNNKIKTFTENGFDWSLEYLDGIYLDNNPIQCDCQMKWVTDNEEIRAGKFTIP